MNQEELYKLEATLKIWNEFEYLENEEYAKVISQKVNVLLELMNSLSVGKIKIESWKIWCEAVIYKLSYHTSSILKLFQGTELPYKHQEKNIIIFDEPSIIILFRAILENYLTFYYLFGSNKAEDLKEFRCLVWRYAGITQRTEFKITSEEARKKQLQEVELLSSLKKEILENKFFNEYDKKQKEKILKGRNARLFNSWKDLIAESGLNDLLFRNLYGYKSNYSHTEFISILQIQMGGYGFNKKNTQSHHFMLLIHGLICKTILELKKFFPSMKKMYDSKEIIIKDEISSIATICSNTNPFLQ